MCSKLGVSLKQGRGPFAAPCHNPVVQYDPKPCSIYFRRWRGHIAYLGAYCRWHGMLGHNSLLSFGVPDVVLQLLESRPHIGPNVEQHGMRASDFFQHAAVVLRIRGGQTNLSAH